MTENHDDATERTEPVLVRPYVKTGTDSAETWPEKYDEQAADAAPPQTDTLVQPVVLEDEPPAPVPSRRFSLGLRLLALVLGVALAGGVAYLILGNDEAPPAQPGALLPKPDNALPTADASSAPGKASPSAKASSSPSASVSASVSVPALPQLSGSPGVLAPPPPPQQVQQPEQTTAPTSQPPTLDPPPSADRSGKITAASGRCLMRGGLLGVDGSPVQVADCGVASTFTVASDGTLRVSGRCAMVTGDSTVRIDDCGGQDSAQWRRGPGDSLVNPASGQCLTDPGRGGATTKATACTGGSEQRWSLP